MSKYVKHLTASSRVDEMAQQRHQSQPASTDAEPIGAQRETAGQANEVSASKHSLSLSSRQSDEDANSSNSLFDEGYLLVADETLLDRLPSLDEAIDYAALAGFEVDFDEEAELYFYGQQAVIGSRFNSFWQEAVASVETIPFTSPIALGSGVSALADWIPSFTTMTEGIETTERVGAAEPSSAVAAVPLSHTDNTVAPDEGMVDTGMVLDTLVSLPITEPDSEVPVFAGMTGVTTTASSATNGLDPAYSYSLAKHYGLKEAFDPSFFNVSDTLKSSSTGSADEVALEAPNGDSPSSNDSTDPVISWDIDGNGRLSWRTDGLLFLYYLANFRPVLGGGKALYESLLANDATRTIAEIVTYMGQVEATIADIDGDGHLSFLTDGILLLRALAGWSGEDLIHDTIGSGASRTSSEEIHAYIDQYRETPNNNTVATASLNLEEVNTSQALETSTPIEEAISWDIDGDGEVHFLTDGLLFLRSLSDFTGNALIEGVVANDADRTSAEEITAYMNKLKATIADIDGDGHLSFLTDGLLLLRALAGFTGEGLIEGVIGAGASRTSADEITAYINQYLEASDIGSSASFKATQNSSAPVITGYFAGFTKADSNDSQTKWSTDAVTADFNNDGNIDSYMAGDDNLYLGDGTGDGDFIKSDIYYNSPYPNNGMSWGATVADFNKDGNADIYLAIANTNNFDTNNQNVLLLGDGTGNFTTVEIEGDHDLSTAVVSADFNKDGNTDLYVVNNGQQNRLWLGDGSGGFLNADINGDIGHSEAVATTDFNNDGNLDIYVANEAQDRLWFGDGTGHFYSVDISHFHGTKSSYSVATADFNNDGNADIYLAKNAGGIDAQNQLWLGDGNGHFTNANIDGDTGASKDAVTADFNADGYTDIYVVNSGQNSQNRLWLGNGRGRFYEASIEGDLDISYAAVVADFNDDGLTDLYVGNYAHNSLWLQNPEVVPEASTFAPVTIFLGATDTAGSILRLYSGTELIASKLLSEEDIAATLVPLTVGESAAGDTLESSAYLITDVKGNFILKPGSHTLTAVVSSPEGSPGQASTAFDIDIEFIKPTVDTLTAHSMIPIITGTTGGYQLQAGDSLQVSIEEASYQVIPNTDGSWSLDLGSATAISGSFMPLVNGTYSVTASIQYAGQGSIADISENELVIDVPAPTVDALTAHSMIPIITGTTGGYQLQAGDSLQVSIEGASYQVIPNTDGSWSLDLDSATAISGSFAPLVNGTYSVTASIQYAGQGSIADISENELVIDVPAPTVDALTAHSTIPIITGTTGGYQFQAGDSLQVSIEGVSYQVIPDIGGSWSLDLDSATAVSGSFTPLVNGTYSVTASIQYAGQGSIADVSENELVIDVPAPTVDTLATDNTSPTITGTTGGYQLQAGDSLQVSIEGVSYQVIPNIDGSWSLDLDSATAVSGSFMPLVYGTYSVTASIQYAGQGSIADKSGNELTIDISPPIITGSTDNFTKVKLDIVVDDIVDVLVADFNNDGNIDIYLVKNFVSSQGYFLHLEGAQDELWLGDGKGNFSNANITTEADDYGNGAVAADFNNDGNMDIYTFHQTPYGYESQNHLWLGDGQGNFTNADISSDIASTYDAVTADFNNDGNTDIYVVNNGPGIKQDESGHYIGQQNQLWLGDGTGDFTNADISGDMASSHVASVTDFNNDGNIDIFVKSFYQNRIWLGDGKGNFIEATIGEEMREVGGTILIADFNNNGHTDIYIGYDNKNSTKHLWLGDGSVNFTHTTINNNNEVIDDSGNLIMTTSLSPNNWDLKYPSADFDKDGHIDFYSYDSYLWLQEAPNISSSALVNITLGHHDTAGDLLRLYSGSELIASKLLTTDDIAATQVDLMIGTVAAGDSLQSGDNLITDTTGEFRLKAGEHSFTAVLTTLDGTDKTSLSKSFEVDIIDGTPENDTLIGSQADNIITGLAGDDTLTGGDGTDTFDYNSTDAGNDSITDFSLGTGGDRIDLSDLLSGYSPSSSELSDFIRAINNGEGAVKLEIDADGDNQSNDDFSAQISITLSNIAPPDDLDTFVADLVANGNLILA